MITRISAWLSDRAANRRSRDLLVSFLSRPTDWEHIEAPSSELLAREHTLRSPEFQTALQWRHSHYGYVKNFTLTMGGKTQAVPDHAARALHRLRLSILRDLAELEKRKQADEFDHVLAGHILEHGETLRKQEKRIRAEEMFPAQPAAAYLPKPVEPLAQKKQHAIASTTLSEHLAAQDRAYRRAAARSVIGSLWKGERIEFYDACSAQYVLANGERVSQGDVAYAAKLDKVNGLLATAPALYEPAICSGLS